MLRNTGSNASPDTPTSVYNLIFGTGLSPAAPGDEVSAAVVPEPVGGATLTDLSAWDLFESGDALFLSALSNFGVGGCAAGPAVDGFGQAGATCGVDAFFGFQFSTPRLLDPAAFTVLNMEVVGLTDDLPADSCGEDPACTITRPGDVNTVPEPGTVVLLTTGLAGLLARRVLGRQPIREA